ncbi:hypothetical protein AB0E08_08415 [Streptomyces sp. NPDC048281]|uniref:hypothetical protein n=1 Tax=Streptomyces sp. NPDC048281 TaxID=3154715 RepID=UPI00343416E7
MSSTPQNTPAKGKPGGNPTANAVIRLLKDAGFQHARYTESLRQNRGFGFYVRAEKGMNARVRVRHQEGTAAFFERMDKLGATEVNAVPADPEEGARLQEYAEVLASRYTVDSYGGSSLYLSARETLPVRPKGVPTAAAVRKALQLSGAMDLPDKARHVRIASVVDQPDHTRVAVHEHTRLDAVRDALTAEGWTFEESENIGHWVLKITGSTPDRPARLRKLRADRAAAVKAQQAAQEAAPAAEQQAPPEGEQEEGAPLGKGVGEALVMGLDGGLRQMPADIPEPEPEPVPYAYSSKGRRWQQGERAEFKTVDGFLYSGEIVGFGEQGGEKTATVRVDTSRTSPMSRLMYKGQPNPPGRPQPMSPAKDWERPLDKLKKPL